MQFENFQNITRDYMYKSRNARVSSYDFFDLPLKIRGFDHVVSVSYESHFLLHYD